MDNFLNTITKNAERVIYLAIFALIVFVVSGYLPSFEWLMASIWPNPADYPEFIKKESTRQYLVACVIFFLAVSHGNRVLSYASYAWVKFLVMGFHRWSTQVDIDGERADELWKWITDQVFVAQRQYAFAMGCLVFRVDKDEVEKGKSVPLEKIQVLVRDRPLAEFRNVSLWPGARVRGMMNDVAVPQFVKSVVRNQTGVEIRIASADDDEVSLTSFGSADEEITNHLHPAPFLIMRQNRPQKNGVPGHVEMLYVGEYQSGGLKNESRWLQCSKLDDEPADRLWPDSRQTIEKAAEWYGSVYLPSKAA